MILQVISFMRERIKIFLSIVAFIIIIISISFILNKYIITNIKLNNANSSINFVSYSFILNNKKELEEFKNKSYINNLDYIEMDSSVKVTLLIKSNEYGVYIENKLKNMDIDFTKNENVSNDDIELYKNVIIYFKIILFSLLSVLVIGIFIQIKLLINWDINNIIILKILGYNDYYLLIITFIKINIILLLSSIISLLIIFFVDLLLDIYISIINCIIAIIISIIITLIEQPLFLFRIKKINYIPY